MADISELIADPAYKAGMDWLAQGNALEALKNITLTRRVPKYEKKTVAVEAKAATPPVELK